MSSNPVISLIRIRKQWKLRFKKLKTFSPEFTFYSATFTYQHKISHLHDSSPVKKISCTLVVVKLEKLCIYDLLVLSFHMGWVWSFHCESESYVHALVYQGQEPVERNQAAVFNFTLKWLSFSNYLQLTQQLRNLISIAMFWKVSISL